MESSSDSTLETLHHLINLANDGKYGYENASNDVKDATLKEFFTQYSSERALYVTELNEAVKTLGGETIQVGDTLGTLHRIWMDIKAAVTSGDRAAILQSCITGEETAVKAYTDALKQLSLSTSLREILTQQLSGIQFALNRLNSLLHASTT